MEGVEVTVNASKRTAQNELSKLGLELDPRPHLWTFSYTRNLLYCMRFEVEWRADFKWVGLYGGFMPSRPRGRWRRQITKTLYSFISRRKPCSNIFKNGENSQQLPGDDQPHKSHSRLVVQCPPYAVWKQPWAVLHGKGTLRRRWGWIYLMPTKDNIITRSMFATVQ